MLVRVALYVAEVNGRQVVGEAEIVFLEVSGRYRWTVAEPADTGWAGTRAEAVEAIIEVIARPSRGTNYRGPRRLWSLPPG